MAEARFQALVSLESMEETESQTLLHEKTLGLRFDKLEAIIDTRLADILKAIRSLSNSPEKLSIPGDRVAPVNPFSDSKHDATESLVLEMDHEEEVKLEEEEVLMDSSTLEMDSSDQENAVAQHKVSISEMEPSLQCPKELLDVCVDLQSGFGFHDLRDHQEELHVKKRDKLALRSIGVKKKHCAYQLFDKMLRKGEKGKQRSMQRKIPKSWEFKYKERRLLRILSHNDHYNLMGEMISKQPQDLHHEYFGYGKKAGTELEWTSEIISPDYNHLKGMCEVTALTDKLRQPEAYIQGTKLRAHNKRVHRLLLGYYGFELRLGSSFKTRCAAMEKLKLAQYQETIDPYLAPICVRHEIEFAMLESFWWVVYELVQEIIMSGRQSLSYLMEGQDNKFEWVIHGCKKLMSITFVTVSKYKENPVLVNLEIVQSLLVILDTNIALSFPFETHYNRAEKVDKKSYNFIGNDVESILLPLIYEYRNMKTSCVFLEMSSNHGSGRLQYGSLPRPPEDDHSDFGNMLQYHGISGFGYYLELIRDCVNMGGFSSLTHDPLACDKQIYCEDNKQFQIVKIEKVIFGRTLKIVCGLKVVCILHWFDQTIWLTYYWWSMVYKDWCFKYKPGMEKNWRLFGDNKSQMRK